MKYNKIMVFMVFTLIACILTFGSASAADTNNSTGLANSSCPEYGINSNHTGQSNYTGPQTNTTKWNLSINSSSSVVTGPNGTIYVAANNGTLYALNKDGSTLWTYDFTAIAGSISTPAVAKNGTIYVADCKSSALYALNPNGSLLWTCNNLSLTSYNSCLVIGSDGTIYVGGSGALYAINLNGTVKWNYTVTGNINMAPAVGSNGIIYAASTGSGTNGTLYAINPDGTLNWTCTIGYVYYDSPSIGADGTIYIGCGSGSSGTLYAIKPDGSVKWTYATSYQISGSPAIGSDGTIYIFSGYRSNSTLYALNSNGTLKWSYDLVGSDRLGSSCVTIGADGTLYVGTYVIATGPVYGNVYAITDNGTSGVVKWIYQTSAGVGSPVVIGSDGTLYISVFSGSTGTPALVAIGDTTVSASPAGGNYNKTQNVTLTSSNGGTIYYTTDGTDPTSSTTRNEYKDTIAISSTTTLKYAVLDGSGNWSPIYTETYTIDSTAPTVVSINPANNSSSKSVNSINITFSEPIQLGNNNITLKNSAGTSIAFTKSINGSTLIIIPVSALAVGTYTLTLGNEAITDLSGNALAAYTSKFTIDTTVPKVSTISPANKALVKSLSSIKVTFNEAVKLGTGTITLKNSKGTSVAFTTSINGTVLTITPKTALASGTYTLTLGKSSITDLAGNALAAYTSTFTLDKTAPTVSAVSPTNGATGVARTKTVSIRLSENVLKGVNWSKVYIKNLKTGTKCKATIWISGNHIYITTSKKAALTWYQVYIPASAIKDAAGNTLAKAYTFKFKTGKS